MRFSSALVHCNGSHLKAGIGSIDAEFRVPLQHGREPFILHVHPEVLARRLFYVYPRLSFWVLHYTKVCSVGHSVHY